METSLVVGVWDGSPPRIPRPEQLQGYARVVAAAMGPDGTVDNLAAALGADDVADIGAAMRVELAEWAPLLRELDDPTLVSLVRFFALAEAQLPGCEAGKRSPAIACARELRARGAYPKDLTPWLRKHSANRFLPYGSVLEGTKAGAARQ